MTSNIDELPRDLYNEAYRRQHIVTFDGYGPYLIFAEEATLHFQLGSGGVTGRCQIRSLSDTNSLTGIYSDAGASPQDYDSKFTYETTGNPFNYMNTEMMSSANAGDTASYECNLRCNNPGFYFVNIIRSTAIQFQYNNIPSTGEWYEVKSDNGGANESKYTTYTFEYPGPYVVLMASYDNGTTERALSDHSIDEEMRTTVSQAVTNYGTLQDLNHTTKNPLTSNSSIRGYVSEVPYTLTLNYYSVLAGINVENLYSTSRYAIYQYILHSDRPPTP